MASKETPLTEGDKAWWTSPSDTGRREKIKHKVIIIGTPYDTEHGRFVRVQYDEKVRTITFPARVLHLTRRGRPSKAK